jgi:hypothetical protein
VVVAERTGALPSGVASTEGPKATPFSLTYSMYDPCFSIVHGRWAAAAPPRGGPCMWNPAASVGRVLLVTA